MLCFKCCGETSPILNQKHTATRIYLSVVRSWKASGAGLGVQVLEDPFSPLTFGYKGGDEAHASCHTVVQPLLRSYIFMVIHSHSSGLLHS